jgi:hypothetical protein
MLTVCFVLLGAMLIQGSFLRSADVFGRYSHTLKIMDWMNRQCAKDKENILYSKETEIGNESGIITIAEKPYSWTRNIEVLDAPNLRSIHYRVQWTESGKPIELQNELYVYKKDPLQSV